MLPNSISEAAIHKAYSSFNNFFEGTDMQNELEKLDTLIKAACSKKPCTNKLLHRHFQFVNSLVELCKAAFIIYRAKHKFVAAWWPLPEGDVDVDIKQLQQYVNPSFNGSPWTCLPRHLSWLQYHNPYKAIKKLVQTMPLSKWEKALQLLLAQAIRPGGLHCAMSLTKLLKVKKRLAQLIEACHLIIVRTHNSVSALAK